MKASGSDFLSNLGKSSFWNSGHRSPWCSPNPDPREPEDVDGGGWACCSVTSYCCIAAMFLERLAIILAKSVVDGSVMV
jgi:hypothetical protein